MTNKKQNEIIVKNYTQKQYTEMAVKANQENKLLKIIYNEETRQDELMLEDHPPTPESTYTDLRKEAYPTIEEQLDYIYHNGLEAWKEDVIRPIKERYPKSTKETNPKTETIEEQEKFGNKEQQEEEIENVEIAAQERLKCTEAEVVEEKDTMASEAKKMELRRGSTEESEYTEQGWNNESDELQGYIKENCTTKENQEEKKNPEALREQLRTPGKRINPTQQQATPNLQPNRKQP